MTGCLWSSVQEPGHPAVCPGGPRASSAPAQTLSIPCPARPACWGRCLAVPVGPAVGQRAPRPHTPRYLALLQGPWAAGRGAEPARGWPGPRLPLAGRHPGSHMCRLLPRLPNAGESHLGPTTSCSAAATGAAPQLSAPGVRGGPLPAAAEPSAGSGGSCQAWLRAPMTSWKLEALSWNNFQKVKIKHAPETSIRSPESAVGGGGRGGGGGANGSLMRS